MFARSFVGADHGAPAPQLGGTVLCVEPSSVQVRLEAAWGVSSRAAVVERVRREVLAAFQELLEAGNVPYDTDCVASSGYVLLGLEARFLDPETYQGFPEGSYTYVTSAQVGSFIPDASIDTALPERRYTGSASDMQAGTANALETHLIAFGREFGVLVVWSEVNTVAPLSYPRFAALGPVLAVLRALALRVGVRGGGGRSSSLSRPS